MVKLVYALLPSLPSWLPTWQKWHCTIPVWTVTVCATRLARVKTIKGCEFLESASFRGFLKFFYVLISWSFLHIIYLGFFFGPKYVLLGRQRIPKTSLVCWFPRSLRTSCCEGCQCMGFDTLYLIKPILVLQWAANLKMRFDNNNV